jgi:hypothetical protein
MESFGAQPVLHPPPPLDKYTHPKEQNERKKLKKIKIMDLACQTRVFNPMHFPGYFLLFFHGFFFLPFSLPFFFCLFFNMIS